MKTILSGFILMFFLVFGCAVATAEPQQQQPVSTMQLDSVEQKLTHQQALMQKDIDRVQYLYSLELDRIRDIADSTDRFGLLLVVIGVLVTILLFIASFATYLTVSSKAKAEASQAAQDWFNSHEQQHQARLDALQSKFDQLDARTIDFQDAIQANSAQVQQHVDEVKTVSDTAKVQIADAMQSVQQRLNRSTEEITQLTEAQKQVLAQQNQNLREKPEAAYTFEDWDVRAFNAYEQGQLDKAVLFWGNAAEVVNATDEKVAQALFNKGAVLKQLNKFEDAIIVYNDLLEKFGSSEKLLVQASVAGALGNKGNLLGELKHYKDAIAAYDSLVEHFDKSKKLVLQEQVARALFNKGVTLGQLLNQPKEAIIVYDGLLERFDESMDMVLQEWVANTLYNKGFEFGLLNRSVEALALYDKLLERFGDTDTFVVQERVASALVQKGITLGKLGRSEDAIEVYDELIQRFDSSDEPALQELVAKALNSKGFVLVIEAKENWSDQAQAQQQLNTALPILQQAISKSSPDDLAMIFGNLAYVEYLLNQPEQAETHLREALEKGGEKLCHATLDDIAMHPIAPDAEFKALLERVWQSISPS